MFQTLNQIYYHQGTKTQRVLNNQCCRISFPPRHSHAEKELSWNGPAIFCVDTYAHLEARLQKIGPGQDSSRSGCGGTPSFGTPFLGAQTTRPGWLRGAPAWQGPEQEAKGKRCEIPCFRG
mgnify:CR=1 FL=1